MASAAVVAKRYAKALWSLASVEGKERDWLKGIESVNESVSASRELSELFNSPVFSHVEKNAVMGSLTEKLALPKGLADFLKYLTQAGRCEALEEIVLEFKKHVLQNEKSVEATVESATPLSSEHKAQLSATLEKLAGRKVELVLITAPELLAGLRIHLLGKTIDASLMSSLESMHRQLLQAEA